MALNSTHPKYQAMLPDWIVMRDTYMGQRQVKDKGEVYLPATVGMKLDGMLKSTDVGTVAYAAYVGRAVFPDHVREAVRKALGLMHQKPATIEVPAGMEALLEKISRDGEDAQSFLRRINEQQLAVGRLGLLLDLPETPDPANPMPYIAMYSAESGRNWDDSSDGFGYNSLNLVVLDESTDIRQAGLEWTRHERYRVLALQSPAAATAASTDGVLTEAEALPVAAAGGTPVYMQGTFDVTQGQGYDATQMTPPMLRGKTLEQIPFVFVNTQDIIAQPDTPAFLGLANIALTQYRGEADYRMNLYMQGQDTLVVIGTVRQDPSDPTAMNPTSGGPALRVGAGARIDLDAVPGADAKYVGVSGHGLEEQRVALENDALKADALSGTLIAPSAGKQESGDALHTRIAAQTASITQVAKAGAEALEMMLKFAAKWMGKDAEKVKVTPNLDFAPALLTGQEVTQYASAKTLGAPLSWKSLHGVFIDRGLTTMTYEEELVQIAEEDAAIAEFRASLPQPPAPPAPPRPGNAPTAPAPAPGAPTPAPAPAGR